MTSNLAKERTNNKQWTKEKRAILILAVIYTTKI
jgi:hypothetical protein